ncbi:glycosyltransferase family 2 protein [bacterium]|nr:glycosyltransferase family 2 protein [bacterium]
MKVLAITPAFNAEKTIDSLIEVLLQTFDTEDILLIDDGSTDHTLEIAKRNRIQVIRFERNMGKGAALKTGFKLAIEKGYDAALTIDSDLQHPPELCANFIDKMKKSSADLVLGDRMTDVRGMPFIRKFSNSATSFFVRLWTGEKMRDSQCGFRLISTSILRNVHLRIDRYQTETELLLEASSLGAKFSYVTIPTIYNEQPSNINGFSETLSFIGLMLSYPFRRIPK